MKNDTYDFYPNSPADKNRERGGKIYDALEKINL